MMMEDHLKENQKVFSPNYLQTKKAMGESTDRRKRSINYRF